MFLQCRRTSQWARLWTGAWMLAVAGCNANPDFSAFLHDLAREALAAYLT